MNGEDPQERPDYISNVINGLERYNPEAVGTLEAYLTEQCEQKFCDGNANRTLLKLYQLNPDRLKDEVVTNVLVKSLTQFPSPQFSLAIHLLNPTTAATGELAEAVTTLRDLDSALEGAQYARFWSTLNGDDLCADLIADVVDFEDTIRHRIAHLVSQAFREVSLAQLGAWLGLNAEGTKKFVAEVCEWEVDGDAVKVPRNPDNEAQKSEIREDVKVDMFSKVIKKSWEDALAA